MRVWIHMLLCLSLLGLAACTKKLTDAPDGHIDFKHDTEKTIERSQIQTTSFYLPMEGGVQLAVDLHLPKNRDGRKLPTILRTTRYARSVDLRFPANLFIWPGKDMVKRFIANGYACVDVDARGSGASSGKRIGPSGPQEVKDMNRVVDWIIENEWSNKKVGATGISYVGTTSEMILVNKHPNVLAVAPRFSYFDPGIDIARPGGIRLASFTEEWSKLNQNLDKNKPGRTFLERLMVRGLNPVDQPGGRADLRRFVRNRAHNWDPDKAARAQPFPYGEWPPDPSLTSKNFGPVGYLESMRQSGAAIYSYGGWFDGAYPRSVINRFLAFYTEGSPHKMILGPWNHGGTHHASPHVQQDTGFDQFAELLRFFDYHLKGEPTGIEDDPPIRYYTMGEERWKTAASWPPRGVQPVRLHLNRDKRLTHEPTQWFGYNVYRVDPNTGTGSKTRWNTLIGRKEVTYDDRRKQGERMLVYQSDPIKEDMEVTGHPVITLYLASNIPQSQFFVYLEDVDREGQVDYVTEGQLRAIHHQVSTDPPPYQRIGPYHSYLEEDAKPLKPGQVTKITFDLIPTSYLFKKGHQIRIAIAGVDKDHFETQDQIPTWNIQWSPEHPSHIELPVMQKGAQ